MIRSLSFLRFHTRDERVVGDLARWMGLLGRFQIVAATFVFILLLAVVALVTTAEILEPATRAGAEDPLVSIGEVSRTAIGVIVALVVGFSLVFFRGGMLLISAAEDLETTVAKDRDPAQPHVLDGALRRLRAYFVLESFLMTGIAVAVYVVTLYQGSGG